RTCTRARRRADGRTFSAARQRANQRSRARAAADEPRGTLAFAFDRARDHTGLDRRFLTVDGYGIELHLKQCSTFEVAHTFGIHYAAARGCAVLNHGFAL